jgi:alpha-mannosidase
VLRIATALEVPRSATADRRGRSAETATLESVVEIELNQGSPIVACRLRVENRASDHRLRILFPTGARSVTESRADTAFGVLRRAAQRFVPTSPMAELPVNAAPLQSVVDAGDGARGMTVLSEGLMEYEVRPAGNDTATIGLTVLRCVGWLSREDLATRRGNAGPSLPTPGAQCLGSHEFRFAFVPRAEPPTESELCDLGRRFLAPPSVVVGTNGPAGDSPLGRRHSFLTLECEPKGAVALSALKKADDRDSVILRVFNPGERPVEAQTAGHRTLEGAHRTNLREQRQQPVPLKEGRASLNLGPRKIATVELEIR